MKIFVLYVLLISIRIKYKWRIAKIVNKKFVFIALENNLMVIMYVIYAMQN